MVYQFMTRVKAMNLAAALPDVTDTSAFSKMCLISSRPFLLREVSRHARYPSLLDRVRILGAVIAVWAEYRGLYLNSVLMTER